MYISIEFLKTAYSSAYREFSRGADIKSPFIKPYTLLKMNLEFFKKYGEIHFSEATYTTQVGPEIKKGEGLKSRNHTLHQAIMGFFELLEKNRLRYFTYDEVTTDEKEMLEVI